MIFFDEYTATATWIGATIIMATGIDTVRRAEVRSRTR